LNSLLKLGLTEFRIALDARFDEFLKAAGQGRDGLVFRIRLMPGQQLFGLIAAKPTPPAANRLSGAS